MLTRDVLNHFNGRYAAVAEAIGITRAAVYQWPKDGHVPAQAAIKLQLVTEGKLKVNLLDYAGTQRQTPHHFLT